jgi:hypothetical protein
VHHLQCFSENNSYNESGQPNSSSSAPRTLSIREPAESAISFSKIKDALKCSRVTAHKRIPARWVTVRRHGKLVRIKRRARTIAHRIVRCHPRVETKRICHAGRCKKQRIVVLPHTVQRNTRHVRYGKGATVSGWLGTASGAALAGQQVQIMTAPDNGSNVSTQRP